jgi:branched-subunit amino acid aminotransferase/4-amino-4-deoxychorismate lyase
MPSFAIIETSNTKVKLMKRYGYLNGQIKELEKMRIDPYDIGVLRGYGVFDVMRTTKGKPFLIDRHWKRFENSAKELHLEIPINFEQYKKTVSKLLKMNNFPESIIRTVLTGGVSADAFSLGKPTFFILIEKYHVYPKDFYEKGIKVITLDFERTNPKAKVTNYVEAIRNQKRKSKSGALEILYLKNGRVLEFSTSNIMLFIAGILVTPKNDVLSGTTRNLVMELARKKYKVAQRDVKEEELKKAQEIFLTAGNKQIMPVVKVDNWKVGNGKVGENTKILMQILEDYMKNY